MKRPALREHSEKDYPFLNAYWYVEDRTDVRDRLMLPSVRMLHKQWLRNSQEEITAYFVREKATRRKYRRWLDEILREKELVARVERVHALR